MNAITLTPQGHLILHKDVLEHLGVDVGNTIIVEKLPDGRVELRAANPVPNISQTFGLLKHRAQKPLSCEEIDIATQKGWAGEQ